MPHARQGNSLAARGAPIILGGLATTLGLEGRRRSLTVGRGTLAAAAIAAGLVAFAVGASIWVFAEELDI